MKFKIKIGKVILALIAILLIGGFGFLLFVDVPVKQTDVSKEISHEHFSEP